MVLMRLFLDARQSRQAGRKTAPNRRTARQDRRYGEPIRASFASTISVLETLLFETYQGLAAHFTIHEQVMSNKALDTAAPPSVQSSTDAIESFQSGGFA